MAGNIPIESRNSQLGEATSCLRGDGRQQRRCGAMASPIRKHVQTTHPPAALTTRRHRIDIGPSYTHELVGVARLSQPFARHVKPTCPAAVLANNPLRDSHQLYVGSGDQEREVVRKVLNTADDDHR